MADMVELVDVETGETLKVEREDFMKALILMQGCKSIKEVQKIIKQEKKVRKETGGPLNKVS